MYIKYLGHSAFLLKDEKVNALIDPFISGNFNCDMSIDEFNNITHIFVTHGHDDHIGDTVQIAKKNGSTIITNFELGNYFNKKGLSVHTMHIGGRTDFDFGTVKMTTALHGSGIKIGDEFIYGGNPCGFVINIMGKKIYHAGDTGLTMDMKLLNDENIDLALIPIGGNYTMDIDDAVKAVDFIQPKLVVPMHYNTFPLIKANPETFKQKVNNCNVKVMKIGDTIEI